jgi:acyl carrier protein
MTPTDTWNTLVIVIREMFGDDTLAIERDTTASQVPGWDSVAHVELMIEVEERFGIRFTTGEAAGMNNVGDMADFIDRHLQPKN